MVAIPVVSFLVVPFLLLAIALRTVSETCARILLEIPVFLTNAGWDALGQAEAHLPESAQGFPPLGLAATVAALVAFALLPAPSWTGKRRCMGLLLIPAVFPLRAATPEGLEVMVFDVGQGSSVLVRSANGTLLYDTGPAVPGGRSVAERAVLPYLRSSRIASLDYLVLSHPDLDHTGGEGAVRARLPPRKVLRSHARDVEEQGCRSGYRRNLDSDLVILVLSGAAAGRSDNDDSCVLQVTYAGRRFLLPGDIGRSRERELVAYWGAHLRSDVLLAAHHGSNTSSSRLWLRSVAPRHFVVTAGKNNRFGHPAESVLERTLERKADVLNTSLSGAIRYHVAPDGRLSCRRYRHRWAPFWRRGEGQRNCGPVVRGHPGILPET